MYKRKIRTCKDCIAQFGATLAAAKARDAHWPGPRCTSHHREYKRQQSAHYHEQMVTKTYGIEAGEYAARYKQQGGKCAICQTATGASKRLAVDHDHKTNAVRGLLCSPCNRFIGRLRDSPEAFLRAYKYLRSELEYD